MLDPLDPLTPVDPELGNPFEFQTPKQIRGAREQYGATRDACAAVVGVKVNTWKEWELGRRKAPPDVLKKIYIHFEAIEDAAREVRVQAEAERAKQELYRMRIAMRSPVPKPTPIDPNEEDIVDRLLRESIAKSKPTPEQEKLANDDLDAGWTYTPQELAAARKTFDDEQNAILERRRQKYDEEMKRNSEILAQD